MHLFYEILGSHGATAPGLLLAHHQLSLVFMVRQPLAYCWHTTSIEKILLPPSASCWRCSQPLLNHCLKSVAGKHAAHCKPCNYFRDPSVCDVVTSRTIHSFFHDS